MIRTTPSGNIGFSAIERWRITFSSRSHSSHVALDLLLDVPRSVDDLAPATDQRLEVLDVRHKAEPTKVADDLHPPASVVGWHIRLFSYMPHLRRSDLRRFWSELLARPQPLPRLSRLRWQDPIYAERRRCVRNSRNRVRRCNLAAKLAVKGRDYVTMPHGGTAWRLTTEAKVPKPPRPR